MSTPRKWLSSPLVPIAVLLIAVAAQLTVWFAVFADRDQTMRIMSLYYIWPAACFLVLLWWLFLSRAQKRTRISVVVVLALATGIFFALFRHEGFTGDFWPIFSWRWQPTAEQRALEFVGKNDARPVTSGKALEITPDDWPQFRGPRRDGIVGGVRIQRDWNANPPKALWRHPVGPAWSSFAVVDDHVYTQEQRGEEETVACYDLNTGNEVWAHADQNRYETAMGGIGPHATPTVHDGRVYTLGPTGILNCLDALTGERLWTTNALEDAGAENTSWGLAGSPLVYDDKVVVNPGGVTAYDRITGEQLWHHGEHPASYAAPQLATIDGVRQILIFDADGLGGHDADTGEELWRSPKWTNGPRVNAARPVVRDDGAVFVSSGYGRGSALFRPVKQGSQWAETADFTDWETSTQYKQKFNGGVVRDGHIYGLDEGILACFDLQTGKRKWKGGRYGYGQVLLVDDEDLLIVLTEKGEVVQVEPTPERHRELAKFQAIEGKTWNHPVLVRGLLLVRNAEEAACYDVRSQTAAERSTAADE